MSTLDEIQDGLDALDSASMTTTPVGEVFTVTFFTQGGRMMTPPTELVRAKFLLDPKYDAVSVDIPATGIYEVTVLYRDAF